MMVVTHREGSISSNIRAIIEQLNLNPIERRRLIESRTNEIERCKQRQRQQHQQQQHQQQLQQKQKQQQQQQKHQLIVADQTDRPRVTIGVYGLRQSKDDDNNKPTQKEPAAQRPRKIPRRIEPRPRQRAPDSLDRTELPEVPRKDASTPTTPTTIDTPTTPQKEDLPSLSTGSLNHTAALHRISVRPKNRRPPRRSNSGSLNTSGASNGLPRIDSVSELESVDTLDSLEASNSSSVAEALTTSHTNDTPPNTPQQQQPPPLTPQQQQQSPQEASKPIPILRKSSSRLSRNSEVFEELEAKLPVLRKPAVSPDSLDSDSRSSSDAALLSTTGPLPSPSADGPSDEIGSRAPPRPMPRTGSAGSERSSPLGSTPPRRRPSSGQRLSKSPDSLESGSPGWLSKSTEGLGCFDRIAEPGEQQQPTTPTTPTSPTSPTGRPIAATRRLLVKPISKSQERVCCSKSSDSLEALEASLNDVDELAGDAIERRHGSFEMRPRRRPASQLQQQQTPTVHKLMSKSTECFDSGLLAGERQLRIARADERARKRASVSEVNLSRGSPGRPLHLSDSFEKIAALVGARREPERPVSMATTPTSVTPIPASFWRPSSKRMAHSSESSDNLELEDNCRLENRARARRSTPKRLSGSGLLDEEEYQAPPHPPRKPSPRLQKSSESSELGSTDTLDSERRNANLKSSDSEETLDSLERELQEPPAQVTAQEQPADEDESILENNKNEEANEESTTQEERHAGPYWRRSQENRESSNGLDINQLLAYTLTQSRVAQENGNEEAPSTITRLEEERTSDEDKPAGKLRGSPLLVYPKKKQQQQSGSDDNKTLSSFSNMLSAKQQTDEDLQNMLNGNISEVSTDTKSFKEKLIMFEKLGK